MFTKVTFQNLRCFKDFTLDNITPLTLISGRNNVGKTTLLEGIFLLLVYRSPELFFKINNIRGIPPFVATNQGFIVGLEPSYLWETLFTDMDMTCKLYIEAEEHTRIMRSVSLEKDNHIALTQFTGKIGTQNMLQPVPGSYILNLLYEYNSNKETGHFAMTANGLALKFDTPPYLPQPPFGSYIGPNSLLLQLPTTDWFGKIEMEDKNQQVVDILRLLDKKLVDLFTVAKFGNIEIYAKWTDSKPRPVRTLGDGINKLLNYLLSMVANPGGIFLLDEIEAGFHYSFYVDLWKIIATVAKETGSQVFATTHSYECITAAVEGTSEIDSSLLNYVRLGKEEGAIVPYTFAGDDLAYALDREIEVR
jgi:ABC-type branched-subunit amino acid transport system ATPase component